MHDAPTPTELIAAVARLLRDEIVPALDGVLSFQARVAANALDLVARQIGEDGEIAVAEHGRLEQLMGRQGSVAELSRALADAIAEGRDPPGLEQHLLATTLAKLAVDQPRYAGISRAGGVFGTLPSPSQDLP
ncbi:DUF6285 domain-containing protein [Sphingomonas crocodyli]|uniref:DUF6285 domain-containing protein n=1 Tax=Sphingomonas crocodyli TaxID=1979270 RepID=UPI0019D17D77|nr:DUF6285 domain-containing protein [Sphingomonas crocodyli]